MDALTDPALRLYREGCVVELTLNPYRPAEPHGLTQYSEIPPPAGVPPGCLRGFDPSEATSEFQATLRLDDWINVKDGQRAQIILGPVLKAPAKYDPWRDHARLPSRGSVAAKIFDPEFYPGDRGAPYSNSEQADGNLSREAGALSHLYKKGLTGYPHFAPQYYGSWAIKWKVGEDEKGEPKYRWVGLVLMEFIDGFSIADSCTRSPNGYLVPRPGAFDFGLAERGICKFQELDKDFRKKVIKLALDGVVRHLHVGVEHHDFDPRNVFVTMIRGDDLADRTRAVLLDYTLSQVWIKTKQGRESGYGEHILELLPHPPHPAERFSVTAMQFFVGWFPSPDREWSAEDQDYTGPEFDNETEFKDWLFEAFGPLHEDGRYSSFEAIPHLKKKQVLGRFLGRLPGAVIANELHPISSDDHTESPWPSG
ncbi:hypothetical protein CTRI78_v003398 [Colletotrichum trifolii]|uniref:Protein kinase domain-containing protein n=1 Tax=Colletotrichum trifolii TaxID=5466 RepID=A0A4R8RN02_COLTR|nr:hypothetical protein CTRI78_v003398 [Colletotrichum trifolii]